MFLLPRLQVSSLVLELLAIPGRLRDELEALLVRIEEYVAGQRGRPLLWRAQKQRLEQQLGSCGGLWLTDLITDKLLPLADLVDFTNSRISPETVAAMAIVLLTKDEPGKEGGCSRERAAAAAAGMLAAHLDAQLVASIHPHS